MMPATAQDMPQPDDARPDEKWLGVILAGGQGRRMGGEDKGWALHQGRPLIQHAMSALAPQLDGLAISANRELERYRALGVPVVQDMEAGYPGPLHGLLSVMHALDADWYLVVPCDMPDLPHDLAATFREARQADGWSYMAHDGVQPQPLVLLVHRCLRQALHDWLQTGQAAVHRWHQQVHSLSVQVPSLGACANLNTPEQLG